MLEDSGAATSPAASHQLLLCPGGLGWTLRRILKDGQTLEWGNVAPLVLLVVLGTLLLPIPQPRVVDIFPVFSEVRVCWFFLDLMRRVILKTQQSVYCDALQSVFKDAEALRRVHIQAL